MRNKLCNEDSMSSEFYGATAVGLAILATFIWRFLGVLIYQKVDADSLIMRLINMLAYSLVGAVMMHLMVAPTGLLATSALSHRLAGLLVGLALLALIRKLPIALLGAITTFGILSLLF